LVTFYRTDIFNLPNYFLHTSKINVGFDILFRGGGGCRNNFVTMFPRLRPHVLLMGVA
jgi:hypothetical protein